MTTKVLALAAALLAGTTVFADAQVYEMTLTLKTTLTAKGKITPLCATLPDDDTGLYRKQGTVRIKGLFWGCDCATIAEPQPVSDLATGTCIEWRALARAAIVDALVAPCVLLTLAACLVRRRASAQRG